MDRKGREAKRRTGTRSGGSRSIDRNRNRKSSKVWFFEFAGVVEARTCGSSPEDEESDSNSDSDWAGAASRAARGSDVVVCRGWDPQQLPRAMALATDDM